MIGIGDLAARAALAARTARAARVGQVAGRRPAPEDRSRGAPDEGRAILEFIFLGVLLLIPLTYLVLTAARQRPRPSPPRSRVGRPGARRQGAIGPRGVRPSPRRCRPRLLRLLVRQRCPGLGVV